jgi:hypothetical protein
MYRPYLPFRLIFLPLYVSLAVEGDKIGLSRAKPFHRWKTAWAI